MDYIKFAVAFFLSIAILLFYLFYLYFTKRIKAKESIFIFVFLVITAVITVLLTEENLFGEGAFIVGFLILWPLCLTFYVIYLFRNNSKAPIASQGNITAQDTIKEFTDRLFADDKFNKALEVLIPKDGNDEKNGLEYLPYMLQSLENKRKRFENDSKTFLRTTIGLGLFFVILIIFFGWLLLNDSSLGIEKDIRRLKNEMRDANARIGNRSIDINKKFRENSINLDEMIRYLDSTGVSNSSASAASIAIRDFERDYDIKAFTFQIDSIIESIRTDQLNSAIYNRLESVRQALYTINNDVEISNSNYQSAIQEIEKAIPAIQQEIDKPANQLNEIIKRLILSVVIVSFFLAILRYVARLYMRNHNLMTSCENEDLALRKFVIALRNTEMNKPERELTLKKFLENNQYIWDKAPGDMDMTKQEASLLKNLIDKILKKI